MLITFDIRTAQPSRFSLQSRYISRKKNNRPGLMFNKFAFRSLIFSTLNALFVSAAVAQARNPVDSGLVQQTQLPPPDDGTWMYTVGFTLFFIVCIAVLLWMCSKKKYAAAAGAALSKGSRRKDNWDSDAIEGDKELEWLRKNNDTINRKRPKKL